MTDTEKTREARIRRQLRRHGFILQKTPARSWLRAYYGAGYMITDDRNCVRCGARPHEYSATLDEVEDFLTPYLAAA
jgi:hypothetical protein